MLSLTMEDAVRLALANNPGIRAAVARLDQAREQQEVAAAPARPQASLVVKRERQQTAEGPPFQTNLGPINFPIQAQPLRYDSTQAGVQVRQLLFDGGRLSARIEEARQSAQGVEQTVVAGYNNLVLEVQLAYLDALQAQRQQVETEQRTDIARRTLKEAEARHAAGSVARADVVYARLPVSQAELAASLSQHDIQTTRARLNRLLGLAQDSPLDLREPGSPREAPGDLPHCLDAAVERRPEVIGQRRELEAARSAARAASRDNNAQLHAVGEYTGVGYNDDVLPTSDGWRIGVELSWPFLDGNLSSHLREQALAREREQAALLEDQIEQVRLQVREAYLEVDAASQAYEVAQVAVGRARESLDMAQGQYRAGIVAFLQVSQAQVDFVQTRRERLEALYDYHRATARLEWAVGLERPELHPPGLRDN